MAKHLFTSESVGMGHPDKVSDQISDAVLDAVIAQDPMARVAIETLVTTGLAMVAGEMTADCYVDIPSITREVIHEVGYTDATSGFNFETCAVLTSIDSQSPDISQGVSEGEGLHAEQGAGDQGIMFGYACRETPELMPMPIEVAHRMMEKAAEVRQNGKLPWLRPDGKGQVTIEYKNRKPVRVHTVVCSLQHDPDVTYKELQKAVIAKIIKPVLPKGMADSKTIYHINPTGRFVFGGPMADTGLTGRKIIVDTYGGRGSHGGGAFSGKDPSKVDRSASYAARHCAKNIVAAGLAEECEVQISYAIGVADPISILVETNGTSKIPEYQIEKIVRKLFDFRPHQMIDRFDLRRPIYKETARFGHFGRKGPSFTWEALDMVEELRAAARL